MIHAYLDGEICDSVVYNNLMCNTAEDKTAEENNLMYENSEVNVPVRMTLLLAHNIANGSNYVHATDESCIDAKMHVPV